MITPNPVLETERLRLRRHRLEDLPPVAALWADPVVVRHIGGRPFTEEECWHRLLRYAGHWSLLGYGMWAVETRGDGRFVGEVGLFEGRREIDESFRASPEAGWVLAPWAHGRGYATEALEAVLADDARARGPDARTVCMIEPDNHASARVAAKVGYRPYMQTTYKGAEVILYARGG